MPVLAKIFILVIYFAICAAKGGRGINMEKENTTVNMEGLKKLLEKDINLLYQKKNNLVNLRK